MADIEAVAGALATRCATISGLRGAQLRDTINPPIVLVGPPTIEFDSTMARGKDKLTFKLYLCVSKASSRAAQKKLNGYCAGSGSSSLKQVLEATAISGVSALSVDRIEDFGDIVVAGVSYLGAIVIVTVYVDGS